MNKKVRYRNDCSNGKNTQLSIYIKYLHNTGIVLMRFRFEFQRLGSMAFDRQVWTKIAEMSIRIAVLLVRQHVSQITMRISVTPNIRYIRYQYDFNLPFIWVCFFFRRFPLTLVSVFFVFV